MNIVSRGGAVHPNGAELTRGWRTICDLDLGCKANGVRSSRQMSVGEDITRLI
jgi:hypothetical protein